MTCPKCGGNNVNVQMVSETKLVTKHHSILWWLFIGWWWLPIKWLFFTLPALSVKLFRPKRYKTVSTHKSMCVCQDCGNYWQA